MVRASEILSRGDLIPAASPGLTLASLLPQALTPTPAHSAASMASTGPLSYISAGMGIWDTEGATLGCRAARGGRMHCCPGMGPRLEAAVLGRTVGSAGHPEAPVITVSVCVQRTGLLGESSVP